MLYHAKNGAVRVEQGNMDYITFGTGSRILVMLPGLGDGLSTVKGKALPFALAYRVYAKEFRVFLFSRKEPLVPGYSTRDMARDQADALDALGIPRAAVLGVSQGGMIAQHLALQRPDLVERLVLAVTAARRTPQMEEAVHIWMDLARRGDYSGLVIDTAERSYSEGFLKRYRPLYPLLTRLGKPKEFQRFLIQAASCLDHDAWGELSRIACPTQIIGGTEDRVIGPNAALELAEAIPNSRLSLCEGLGHAAYEEARDFHTRVLEFLRQ